MRNREKENVKKNCEKEKIVTYGSLSVISLSPMGHLIKAQMQQLI